MRTSNRGKILAGSATAKLTRDEEGRVKACADNAGLTKSEWCRRVILTPSTHHPKFSCCYRNFSRCGRARARP